MKIKDLQKLALWVALLALVQTVQAACSLDNSTLRVQELMSRYVPRGSNGRGAAGAVYLFENQRLVKTIYEKNSKVAQAIASTQKVLTAWTAFESARMSATSIFNSDDSFYDSFGNAAKHYNNTTNIRIGERVTLLEYMRTMMYQSSNGAAHALARGAGGSVTAFMSKMNAQAKSLLGSSTKTFFQNSSGLTDNGARFRFTGTTKTQQSTASDLAKITGYVSGDLDFMNMLEDSGLADTSEGYLYKVGFTQAAGKTVTFSFPVAGCRKHRLAVALFGQNTSAQFNNFASFYYELRNRAGSRSGRDALLLRDLAYNF